MTGQFVVSKAGHDKDEIYIIIEETDKDVWVANGKEKTVSHPKRKNRKHVTFLTKYLDPDQTKELVTKKTEADLLIKREIRLYKKEKDGSIRKV